MKNETKRTTARAARAVKPNGRIAVTDVPSAMAFARTVTPDSFGAELARVNANHGIMHGARNVNRWNGTRIEYTQNETFVRNVDTQLTDVQMLFVWCAAFPMATGRVFDANRATDAATMRDAIVTGARIVNGARATFNAGRHGCPAPAVPSVRYGSPKTTFTNVAPVAPKR
jgi:hypothetical protein